MLVAFPSKLNSIEEWFFILSVPFWFPKSFQLLALCQSMSVLRLSSVRLSATSVTPLVSYRYTCDVQIVFVFCLCLFLAVPEINQIISQHVWKIYPKWNPKLWKITVFATCVLLRFASQNTSKFIKKSSKNHPKIIPKSLKIHPKSFPEGVPAGILKNPCF